MGNEAKVRGSSVKSADGTVIGFDRSGSGPAVILIGGAFNDRSTTKALAEVLSPAFTVYHPRPQGTRVQHRHAAAPTGPAPAPTWRTA